MLVDGMLRNKNLSCDTRSMREATGALEPGRRGPFLEYAIDNGGLADARKTIKDNTEIGNNRRRDVIVRLDVHWDLGYGDKTRILSVPNG